MRIFRGIVTCPFEFTFMIGSCVSLVSWNLMDDNPFGQQGWRLQAWRTVCGIALAAALDSL